MHAEEETSSQPIHRHCPLCHSGELETRFTGIDRMYGKPGQFPVCRCRNCDLHFLGQRLSVNTLSSYYPDTYYAYEGGESPARRVSGLKRRELLLRARVERAALAMFLGYPSDGERNPFIRFLARRKRKKYEQLPPFTEGGRLLDVGCGGGAYLAAMRKLGWQVEGVEPSRSGCDACRRQQIKVHEGTLEAANLQAETFDFIRFEHVLEHVPEPIAALKEAGRILKSGGTIRVLVPNIASLPARWFGTYWYHLDTPRHLFWFSPDTIRLLANKAGLQVTHINIQTDYSDIADSLIYWLRDHYPALGARMGRRKLLWKLCNKLCLPLRVWMNLTGQGSLLVVSLQKRTSK